MNKKTSATKDSDPVLLKHFRGHRDSILNMDFHPNLPHLASCGADGHVTIWNYKQETRALRYEGHKSKVNDVKFSKAGDLMATAGDDATIRLWVPTVKGEVRSFRGHSSGVQSVGFHPTNPGVLVSGGNDKTVKFWSIGKPTAKIGTFIKSLPNCHTNWVRSVRFSSDGKMLVSASDDSSVCVVDTRSYQLVAKIPLYLGKPTLAEFNPCAGQYIGISTANSSFVLHDLRLGKLVQVYEKLQEGSINSFAFHPSGDYAVTVADDANIKILDLVEGRPIYTLYGPREAVNAVAFSTDGNLMATGGKDKELLIWEPYLEAYENNENQPTSASSDAPRTTKSQDSSQPVPSPASSDTGTFSSFSNSSVLSK